MNSKTQQKSYRQGRWRRPVGTTVIKIMTLQNGLWTHYLLRSGSNVFVGLNGHAVITRRAGLYTATFKGKRVDIAGTTLTDAMRLCGRAQTDYLIQKSGGIRGLAATAVFQDETTATTVTGMADTATTVSADTDTATTVYGRTVSAITVAAIAVTAKAPAPGIGRVLVRTPSPLLKYKDKP